MQRDDFLVAVNSGLSETGLKCSILEDGLGWRAGLVEVKQPENLDNRELSISYVDGGELVVLRIPGFQSIVETVYEGDQEALSAITRLARIAVAYLRGEYIAQPVRTWRGRGRTRLDFHVDGETFVTFSQE